LKRRKLLLMVTVKVGVGALAGGIVHVCVREESNKAEGRWGTKYMYIYQEWFVVPAGLIIIMKVVFLPLRIF